MDQQAAAGPMQLWSTGYNGMSGITDQLAKVVIDWLGDYIGFSGHQQSSKTQLVSDGFKVVVYFVLLFVTWGHSLWDVVRVGKMRYPVLSLFLFLFALYNVVEAWILIFNWLQQEFLTAKEQAVATGDGTQFSWEDWFVNIDLFTKAYRLVVTTFFQWFWSSQLLHFVSSLVLFTYVEFHRSGSVRPLSNFWLGCAAAISLSFPYVLYIVINTKPQRRRARIYVPLSKILLVCLFVANASVVLLPRVDSEGFGPVLAALHISLCIPLILAQLIPSVMFPAHTTTEGERRHGSWWVVIVYGTLAGVSATMQLVNVLTAITSHAYYGSESSTDLLELFLKAFCANPCQCSISGDVLRTSVTFAVFILWMGGDELNGGMKVTTRLLLVGLTPILSVGTTFPLWAAMREVQLHVQPFSYLERVQRILLKYRGAQAKAGAIEGMLRAHAGNEELYIRQLVNRYGPEPRELVVKGKHPRHLHHSPAAAAKDEPTAAGPSPPNESDAPSATDTK